MQQESIGEPHLLVHVLVRCKSWCGHTQAWRCQLALPVLECHGLVLPQVASDCTLGFTANDLSLCTWCAGA